MKRYRLAALLTLYRVAVRKRKKEILKFLLQVGRLVKIVGLLLTLGGYLLYASVWSVNDNIDVLYWLPNMIGLGLTFLGIGLDEANIKIKHLVYYPVSVFFFILPITYLLNTFLDPLIEINEVIITLITTTVICLLYYFYKTLPRK